MFYHTDFDMIINHGKQFTYTIANEAAEYTVLFSAFLGESKFSVQNIVDGLNLNFTFSSNHDMTLQGYVVSFIKHQYGHIINCLYHN